MREAIYIWIDRSAFRPATSNYYDNNNNNKNNKNNKIKRKGVYKEKKNYRNILRTFECPQSKAAIITYRVT